MDELYSYIDTKLMKLNFIHPSEGGSIVRRNEIIIEKKEFPDKEPMIIVKSYDKLVQNDTENIILDIEFRSEFVDKNNIVNVDTIDEETKDYLRRPALSESSLLIGLITSKAFEVPAIFPPIVMSEFDE